MAKWGEGYLSHGHDYINWTDAELETERSEAQKRKFGRKVSQIEFEQREREKILGPLDFDDGMAEE